MTTMTYNDNEGYGDQNAQEAAAAPHIDAIGEHAGAAFNGVDAEGNELSVGERTQNLGDMYQEEGAALKDHGDGFSEAMEHEFEGDGSVGGEALEAGVAIGGELLEGASEAGTAIVGATLDAFGSAVEGIGDGIVHGEAAWDAAMSGDLNTAGTELAEGLKDVGNGVVDAVGTELGGVVDMAVEIGEGLLSTGWEIGEGIAEVGEAIGNNETFQDVTGFVGDAVDTVGEVAGDVVGGIGDAAEGAWDFVFGGDEESSDAGDSGGEEEVEEAEAEDDSWF